MKGWAALCLLLGLGCVAAACATTSPLANDRKDYASIAGVWEEDWPGQTTKDRYRIDVQGDALTVTPLTNPDGKQRVHGVIFHYKQLMFYLEMEDGTVFYDMVLVSKDLLTGRARGGRRHFDEPIQWNRVNN